MFFHFGIRTFYPGHKDWDGNEAEMTPDGFVNWPSAYTSYNISRTPWKDGKGDVVADYVAACREYGLKVGLYFSPADANIIGKKLTAEEYDQERIIRVIRTLQPEILIFNMWDPDTMWIGNEEGMAPIRSYNEVEDLDFSVRTDRKDLLESRKFLPAECGMRMRRDTWFGSEQDEDTIKALDQLMGIYDCTVGKGINLLLNIGPDASGQLPEADVRRVLEFGHALQKRFASPLFTLENPLLDEDKEELIIDLPEEITINCIVLSEYLRGRTYSQFSDLFPASPGGKKAAFL